MDIKFFNFKNQESEAAKLSEPNQEDITKFLKADFKRLQKIDRKIKIINVSYKLASVITLLIMFTIIFYITYLKNK